MSEINLVSFNEHRDGAKFEFSNTTKEYVINQVVELLAKEKYKLESGMADNGIYGRGNAVLRILFGAFHKRFKFQFNITEEGSNVIVSFSKAMSGFSGGAIGLGQLNKEVLRLTQLLKNLK